MDVCALKQALWRQGLTIPKLAQRMGVSKKLIYSRVKGETAFKQTEICNIQEILGLSSKEMIIIFFDNQVS